MIEKKSSNVAQNNITYLIVKYHIIKLTQNKY